LDISTKWISTNKRFEVILLLNNIFNEVYTETNLVPMPRVNGSIGIQYNII